MGDKQTHKQMQEATKDEQKTPPGRNVPGVFL